MKQVNIISITAFSILIIPVNELDTPLGLDGGDGLVDVLWHDVPPVEHHAGHVLP